ncbi:MAG TPA: PAS domain-containing protein, partial [Thermodesulfovibrionales bacterium]|nr:PAS domain-containing protein [Thermodesulfovibrionales bacterium]
MFRARIIYRLVGLLLVFALMIVGPYSFSVIKQVEKMIEKETAVDTAMSQEEALIRREFTPQLIDQMVPFAFYVLIMAFFLSIFFLRKMLISLRNLREGTRLMRDGNLDVRLDVITEDELGEVTKAFNDMARALKAKTQELSQKNMYVNAMLDPLWVVDQEDRIVDINPAFERLFGHGRDDVIGASIFDLLDEENAHIMRKQLDEKRAFGIASAYELSILAKNGQSIPVLVSGSPIFSGDQIIGKIGVMKDFREQGSLRSELQNSLDYIETIMNSIPEELIVIDRNHKIIMANKVAIENAEEDLIGKHCHQLLHKSPVPCGSVDYDCPTDSVFADGRSCMTIHEHTDATGGKRNYEIIASPVKDSSGKVQHVIELLRDVTERVKTEAEIVRKNRELTVLNNISGILNRSLKPDEIFTKVLDKLAELLSMDGGGIFFLDEA